MFFNLLKAFSQILERKFLLFFSADVQNDFASVHHNKAVSVIKGLLQGTLSITVSDNAFGGYALLAVVIPDEIPFVGGKEIGGLEFAINNKFVGGNFRIIGIKFGVIYYWSGDFDFGTGIDLTLMESAYPDAFDILEGSTEDGSEYIGDGFGSDDDADLPKISYARPNNDDEPEEALESFPDLDGEEDPMQDELCLGEDSK